MVKFAQMPKYEAYKDSGVEWLGEIPAHWQLLSLKRIVKEHSGNGFPIELQGQSGSIPFLKVSDIGGYGHFVESSNNYVSKKTINQKKWNVVPAGSLVTAKIGEAIRKNHRKLLIKDSIIDNNCIAFECVDVDIKFNFYMHLIIDFDWFVNPGAVPSISVSKYKAEKTAIPSINEQTLIANFLDQKTAQIDAAIAIKEQQIELLKERKQIIIQQAVTQGLDPNVPMKDSGVDWIGQIPEHWEMMSLRYAFNFLNNKRIPLSAVEREGKQGEYPYYGASGIIDYVNDYIFEEELILIAEDGANLLSKSTPLAFVATGKYWVNNHAHIIKPKFIGFKYWAELLSSLDYTVYISGAAQPKLTRDNLASVRVPVPPLVEIDGIIHYINSVEPDLNRAIKLQEKQIQKLKEYKTTLINSAVTGKIKITPEMLQA